MMMYGKKNTPPTLWQEELFDTQRTRSVATKLNAQMS